MSKVIHIAVSDDFTLTYGDFKVDPAQIAEKGLAYLLQYGFSQSLQDSVAGHAAKLKAETVSKTDLSPKWNDAEIATQVYDRMAARVDAISTGDVGTGRVGPRVLGIEAVMREVAFEAIKLHAAKNKVKLPAKAEERNKLIDSYLAKYAAKARTEAERRMAAVEEIEIAV